MWRSWRILFRSLPQRTGWGAGPCTGNGVALDSGEGAMSRVGQPEPAPTGCWVSGAAACSGRGVDWICLRGPGAPGPPDQPPDQQPREGDQRQERQQRPQHTGEPAEEAEQWRPSPEFRPAMKPLSCGTGSVPAASVVTAVRVIEIVDRATCPLSAACCCCSDSRLASRTASSDSMEMTSEMPVADASSARTRATRPSCDSTRLFTSATWAVTSWLVSVRLVSSSNTPTSTVTINSAVLLELTNRTETSQDVTAQVADVNSRVESMTASVARVRALLASATGISDVISIESELAVREANLESLQQQQAALSGQVALSTISITLTAVTTDAAGTEPAPQDSGFIAGLNSGWAAMLGFLGGLAGVLGALLPFLPLIALAGLLIWWLIRRARRARSAQTDPITPRPQQTAAPETQQPVGVGSG